MQGDTGGLKGTLVCLYLNFVLAIYQREFRF